MHFYTSGATSLPSFIQNPWKDVGGIEKTNFDAMEGRNDGMTEWQNDGMTEGSTKQTLNAPLPFYGGGIIKMWKVNDGRMTDNAWSQYCTWAFGSGALKKDAYKQLPCHWRW